MDSSFADPADLPRPVSELRAEEELAADFDGLDVSVARRRSSSAAEAAALMGVGDGFDPSVAAMPRKPAKPRTAVVSLLSGQQIEFTCDKGRETTAAEMLALAVSAVDLPPDTERFFALFAISTSLHIQLKPHHQPFKVLKKWSELMALFTNNPEPDNEAPLIYLKRADMCHQGLERDATDPRLIRLLFDEMTFNIVYSFYPCELDEAARLAAYHVAIELILDADLQGMAVKDVVENCEGCQLPDHLRKKISTRKWRRAVAEAHECLVLDSADVNELRLRYLREGRRWPYYGATFFYGHIEPPDPSGFVMRERPDELVRVGVNLDGIHVVRDSSNELILSLGFDELQYNSYDADNGASEPSFLIEYSDENSGTDRSSFSEEGLIPGKAQMVIWTPQAGMIDSLVSRHIEALGDWADLLHERKQTRVSTYRPTTDAKGRKHTVRNARAPGAFFTLSRFKSRRPKSNGAGSGGGGKDKSNVLTPTNTIGETKFAAEI